MITKQIEIKVKTDKANKSVKDLNKEIDNTGKKTTEAKEKASGFGSTLDKMTGGAITKVKGLVSSLKGVTLGFRSIGVAIAASGIGLVLVAIAAITAAFKSSEEGQNKFAKLMAVIGTVVGNVTDVLSDLGMFLIDLFSGDGEAMKSLKSFGNQIFDIVGLPIKNIIDTVKALGKVLGALFDGDIDKAFNELQNGVEQVKGNFNEAKEAANDFYDSAIQGSKDFIEQQRIEIAIAQQIADQRAKADKLERGLIVDRAEANRKIAELRDKAARADLFSLAERKDALLEASVLNEQITNQEIEAAILRRDAIIEENKLSKSNKEALNAEEQAKAKVIELETKRLNLQKRLGTEIASLNNQEAARYKANVKAAEERNKKEIEEERKRLEKIEKIREKFEEKQRDLEAKTEEEKLELEAARAEEDLKLLIGTEEEKELARIEIEDFFNEKRKELREKRAQEAIELAKKTERERTEEERKQAETRRKIAELEAQAKKDSVNSYLGFLSSASEIAGKETAAGKALAVASTLASTYQAAQGAYASQVAIPTPDAPIRAAIAAASAVASGLANVKSILAVKVQGQSGGTGGNNASGTPQQAQPAFNLTGRSNVNQLQTGLEQQETAPVRAFVVGSNVTSQQEADRATQSQAAFG